MLVYDDSKDLSEGLITEVEDDAPSVQIALVLPLGRRYGYKLAASLSMYESLREICSILSINCSVDYLYKHNLSLPLSTGQRSLAKANGIEK